MKKIIEALIQKRNPAFSFDEAVNSSMLFSFTGTQIVAMLRGYSCCFFGRSSRRMLMGKGARLQYIQKIKWGRYLKLGEQVYISGLGKQGVRIGDNVSIGAYSRVVVATTFNNVGEFIHIGNNVGIGEFAYLGGAGGLSIGDDCIIGQYFSCHAENHVYNDANALIRHLGVTRKGISIGSNCWIGSKVTILDGVEIGAGCVIAAGAVVNRSFPSNSVIGGVPARLLRKRVHTEEQDSIFQTAPL